MAQRRIYKPISTLFCRSARLQVVHTVVDLADKAVAGGTVVRVVVVAGTAAAEAVAAGIAAAGVEAVVAAGIVVAEVVAVGIAVAEVVAVGRLLQVCCTRGKMCFLPGIEFRN